MRLWSVVVSQEMITRPLERRPAAGTGAIGLVCVAIRPQQPNPGPLRRRHVTHPARYGRLADRF